MKTIEELEELNPCADGLIWARQQPSLYEAWETCERSDWMWWLLRKLNKTPKQLSVSFSEGCAEHIEASIAAARAAARAARAAARSAGAARAAADDAAAYAARAAAYAARAAAYAARAAAYAACAAARAAAYAAAACAERKWQADLLRNLTKNPFEKL